MAAFVFAGQPLTAGHQVVFPSRRLANLDQDVDAHEFQDLRGQTFLPVMDGRTAHPELSCDGGTLSAFDHELDDGFVPC